MQDIAFREKFIHPYYSELMGLNFLKKTEDETTVFFQSICSLALELNNEKLAELLNNEWRLSKVGAWMIALSNRTVLKSDLEKYLQNENIHYCEHALLSFFILNGRHSAKEIIEFVKRQTGWFVKTGDVINLERLSIDWGLSILNYLDVVHGTDHIERIQNEEWWATFDTKIRAVRHYEAISQKFNANYHFKSIEKLMQRVQNFQNNFG